MLTIILAIQATLTIILTTILHHHFCPIFTPSIAQPESIIPLHHHPDKNAHHYSSHPHHHPQHHPYPYHHPHHQHSPPFLPHIYPINRSTGTTILPLFHLPPWPSSPHMYPFNKSTGITILLLYHHHLFFMFTLSTGQQAQPSLHYPSTILQPSFNHSLISLSLSAWL